MQPEPTVYFLPPLLIFAFMPIKSEIYQGKLHRAATGEISN